MVGIAFYFCNWVDTAGESEPKVQLARWSQNAKALYATDLIMIDTTQYRTGQYYRQGVGIKVHYFTSLEEAEKFFSEPTWVYLECEKILKNNGIKPINLIELKHPENTIYCVGPNYSSIPMKGRADKMWVYIPTSTSMYAEQASMIPLWDRVVKSNRNIR